MRICRQYVSEMLHKGHEKVTYIADYTAKFIFERAAQFLIHNGGWVRYYVMNPQYDIKYCCLQPFNSQSGLTFLILLV